jgi:hypothetical protein
LAADRAQRRDAFQSLFREVLLEAPGIELRERPTAAVRDHVAPRRRETYEPRRLEAVQSEDGARAPRTERDECLDASVVAG